MHNLKTKDELNIVLCGATYCESGNYGDVLMEMILKDNIASYVKNINFVYYRNVKKGNLRDFDLFIYTPGGYLGYIEKWYSGSWRKTLQRLRYYYIPGILAILAKIPVVLVGQGVGPYEYKLLRPFLKYIFNKAALAMVRDTTSYQFLKNIGVKNNIFVTADTAQTLLNHNYVHDTMESSQIKEKFSGKTSVFIHYADLDTWKQKIIDALDRDLFKNPNICFVIGADGVFDTNNFAEFIKCFPDNRFYAYHYNGVYQFLSIMMEVDCIITCKLHAGITGCTMSKSVICFSVQYDKTICYYTTIGYSDRVYDLFNISADQMAYIIDRKYNEKIILKKEILHKAEMNYILLKEYICKELQTSNNTNFALEKMKKSK
jgi:polysaccharide pyruvyl transferase WcaK-like protein